MSLLFVYVTGNGDVAEKVELFLFVHHRCLCFLCHPKFLIKSMRPLIINHFHISGNYIAGDHIDMHDNPNVAFYQEHHSSIRETSPSVEDVVPVDTSFFCTQHFSEDIIEKNLRQAISLASSKADACRRIMALEPLGYVVLSNVTDE